MMSKRNHHYTRGTTLIELMLYLAISTGIIIGVGATSLAVLEQREKARTIDDVRYALAVTLGTVSDDVREASGITSPPVNTGSTTLVLRFANPLRNPTIIEASGGTLYRTVATGTRTQILPTFLVATSTLFTHIEGTLAHPSVVMTGTLSEGARGAQNTYQTSVTFDTAATLRAPQP